MGHQRALEGQELSRGELLKVREEIRGEAALEGQPLFSTLLCFY
jgi:hypothetical protein